MFFSGWYTKDASFIVMPASFISESEFRVPMSCRVVPEEKLPLITKLRFRESVAEQIHDLHLLNNMSIVLRAVEANASGRKGEGHAAGHAKRRRRSGGGSMAVFLDLIRARDPSG